MANGDFYECSERDLIVIPRLSAHKVVIKKDCKYERCLINIDEAILGVLEMASQLSSSLASTQQARWISSRACLQE
jgi:hypothetical protein